MIRYLAFLRSVLAAAPPPKTEYVPPTRATGRTLLADAVAHVADPAEARSAMDGYAVRRADLLGAAAEHPIALPESGLLAAGRQRSLRLPPGGARRIMTGAPLPPGADAVVPVEQIQIAQGRVLFSREPVPGQHVRRPAENFNKGDVLISSGTVLRSQEIGLCVTAGIRRLKVARRIRVGVLATGSELVSADSRLRRGEVFDSNRPMILSRVEAACAEPVDMGHIRDSPTQLKRRLGDFRNRIDLLVTIGGISAGDFDVVKIFLNSFPRVRQVRVAMRPAKPQAFGPVGRILWYALPGNPVSAWVAFDRFVQPLIFKAMGRRHLTRPVRKGRCLKSLRKPAGLREFVRASAHLRRGEWRVRPVGPPGSSNLRSVVHANAFLVLSESCRRVDRGDIVDFELFADLPGARV